jgi:hypothetical protein
MPKAQRPHNHIQTIQMTTRALNEWTKQLLIGTFNRTYPINENYFPPDSLRLTGGKYITSRQVEISIANCYHFCVICYC